MNFFKNFWIFLRIIQELNSNPPTNLTLSFRSRGLRWERIYYTRETTTWPLKVFNSHTHYQLVYETEASRRKIGSIGSFRESGSLKMQRVVINRHVFRRNWIHALGGIACANFKENLACIWNNIPLFLAIKAQTFSRLCILEYFEVYKK